MLITNNEEALRVVCSDVLDNEVGSILDSLEKEFDNCNRLGKYGIGLAAPQIGIAKKMAIVRIPTSSSMISLNLINCSIEQGYDLAPFRSEGCLSFPGRVEDTERYQEIVVSGNLGTPNKFIANGLLAVVIQHELDHLNSTLFMDRSLKSKQPVKTKVGPNDPCICGSNKKYKKCCKL